MKLLTSLLLTIFVGTAASSSDASVYIFQGPESPSRSNPPTLSPEQARLVFAQRLGTSQYHGLGDASEIALSYINRFGGRRESLFKDAADDKAAELLLIVEGVSPKTAQPLIEAWSSIIPAFTISKVPSMTENRRLVSDLNQQIGQGNQDCALEDAINPFDASCWSGKSKVIHFDLGNVKNRIENLMSAQERLIRFAKKEEMNVVVVLMPESSRSAKSSPRPYGRYEAASQSPIGRRQGAEEPIVVDAFPLTALPNKQMKVSDSSDNFTFEPITGVPQLCHSSLDDCIASTNNCSGHGACYQKYGNIKNDTGNANDTEEAKGSCFTCGCVATWANFTYAGGTRKGFTVQYWGGAACHKRDVSAPFWLIGGFTVVLVGIVSWGIGLLFSIGEEQLPGVIGAGVSSKAR